uniref:LRR binding FLII interacting protein 1 n=1 Tax=Monodelphis domestica TaxID=13616 RepID=A0A5F8GY17_MONDO
MEMGTQGSGRRRLPQRERLTAEDDALSQIAREAEARLAAKRAARAEAREIRMKELERQQKEASDEDERMSVGSRGSLRVEERPEKDFTEKGSRNMPSLSAATLASLGGTSSRRGSGDTSISVDTEASIREIKEINELKDQIQDVEGKYMQGLKEMKDSLAEVEEKYKKAMVSNAQLDNEKTNFMYQVDTLKDALLELEEQLAESRRQYEEKNKEFERQKHAHSVLQFQFAEAKEALKQREEMLAEIRQLQQKQDTYVREVSDLQETIEWKDKKIGALERQKEYLDSVRSERDDLRAEAMLLKEELKKHGIILNSEVTTNGEPLDNRSNMSHLGSPKVSQEETNALKSSSDGTLDIRLKNLVDERECLLEQIKKLKGQLEERQKNGKLEISRSEDAILENGTDIHVLDLQRDANRQISDLKFKLAKSEQEITALEQNVIRLEGQVSRYKSAAENAERVEDELKAEKRKLQRELRSALDKTEELEVSNGHLVKRLEKMKANRSALLSQQ